MIDSALENLQLSRRPMQPEIVLVDRQEQINEICDQCRVTGRFAFDTEFVMEESFESELCLIQIATATRVAIIDPFLDLDSKPVWDLVCDQQVETVVCAGQEDLALCVQHTGVVPRRIYDVQIAAGFAGYGYPQSLQKLIQTTLHVRLHKSKTLTDWRKRPLSEAQIRYAADDVSYLPAVHERLCERLAARGRLEWLHEECSRFEDISLYRRADEEKLVRVKGTAGLKGRQLAVLRELLAWRETAAKQLNRPTRAVLRDHLLVEVARHELCSFDEVRDLRGLNLSDRHVRALCQVVQDALAIPSAQWPKQTVRETETSAEAALIALITGVMRGYCVEHDLAYGLAASKKLIRDLVRHHKGGGPADPQDVELLKGWRGKAFGTMLKGLFAGEQSIRIGASDCEPVLYVTPTNKSTPGDATRS